MKKNILRFIIIFTSLLTLTTHDALAQTAQDIQIYTASNKNSVITTKSIEEAFNAIGLTVAGNNNMNIPFEKRFHKVHYKVYNLAMFMSSELTYKLLKKYPSFGALTPLTMSIWENENGQYEYCYTHI